MDHIRFYPRISNDTAKFWDGCRQHRLCFQKCSFCGNTLWPAAAFCPECGSPKLEQVELSGKGKIYSFTIFYRAFDPQFEPDLPYVVASIDLDDGPTIISNIIHYKPSELKCDARVRLVWKDEEETTLPLFKIES